jgi:hypothetical protein
MSWVPHPREARVGCATAEARVPYRSSSYLTADREALPSVLRVFEFIHQRDGVVLHRDAALSLVVDDEVVPADAELAGAFAGVEVGGRTKVGPADRGRSQQLQRAPVGFCNRKPLGRQLPGSLSLLGRRDPELKLRQCAMH